jgi:Acyl-CoA carboxylase epsilon subunit
MRDRGQRAGPSSPNRKLDGVDEPLRVVRGNPTADEVAALVGVLLLGRPAAAEPAPPAGPVSRWRVSGRPTLPLRPGPGAWRASARPGG